MEKYLLFAILILPKKWMRFENGRTEVNHISLYLRILNVTIT